MTNTDSRRDEMFETISQVLHDDFLSKKKGEQLRGRLQFAECQIGRTSGMALKRLFRFVASGGGKLDDQIRATLLTLRDRVMFAAPRCINANLQHVLHLHVDASNDDETPPHVDVVLFIALNTLGGLAVMGARPIGCFYKPDDQVGRDGCSPYRMLLRNGRYLVDSDGGSPHRMLPETGRYQVIAGLDARPIACF